VGIRWIWRPTEAATAPTASAGNAPTRQRPHAHTPTRRTPHARAPHARAPHARAQRHPRDRTTTEEDTRRRQRTGGRHHRRRQGRDRDGNNKDGRTDRVGTGQRADCIQASGPTPGHGEGTQSGGGCKEPWSGTTCHRQSPVPANPAASLRLARLHPAGAPEQPGRGRAANLAPPWPAERHPAVRPRRAAAPLPGNGAGIDVPLAAAAPYVTVQPRARARGIPRRSLSSWSASAAAAMATSTRCVSARGRWTARRVP